MYGHDRIAQFWKKMNQPVKVAFFSALSIGLLVYLFAMTNLFFTTGDTLNNVYFTGELTWLGRWSSKWLSSLSTSYTMPYVNGVIVIFSVAALSALLVSYFEIKSSVLALLSAGVMMCYPSVAKTLGYLHNADAYMLAAMLSVLGLYLLEKYRWRGFLPSVLLIALGTGTYQACASLVVAMMFVRGVQLLVCSMQSGKALAVRFLQYVMCVAVSLVTYYVLAQLFAGVSRISISDYQSIARSASIDTLLLFPQNFIGCYSDFGNTLYTLADQPDYVVGGWPCILYALLTIGMTFRSFMTRHGRNWQRFGVLCLLVLLAPFFLCCIRIFNPENVYILMMYSATGIYLLGLVMMDALPHTSQGSSPLLTKTTRWTAARVRQATLEAMSWLMVICLAGCIVVWSIGSNTEFYLGKMDYENMYAQCSAFLTLAESNQDYIGGMPILVMGDSGHNGGRMRPELSDTKAYYAFMKYIMKVTMPFGIANDIRSEARAIAETEDFILMPCYPEEGCAQVIGDVMIIKLSETLADE